MSAHQPIRSAKKPGAQGHGKPGPGVKGIAVWSRIAGILLLVLQTLVMSPQLALSQGDSASEYELKAAMLYNLMHFVEWPPSAYPDPQAAILLCVLGRDPFGGSLTTTVSKPTAIGRPVLARHVQQVKDVRDCQVLYISSSERKTLPQIFSALKGASVLTVGEMSQFAARGGMIQFSLEDKQIRFDVNVEAASQGGLKISSRLLLLSRIVRAQNRDQDDRKSGIPASFLGMVPSVSDGFGLGLEGERREVKRSPRESVRGVVSDKGDDRQMRNRHR